MRALEVLAAVVPVAVAELFGEDPPEESTATATTAMTTITPARIRSVALPGERCEPSPPLRSCVRGEASGRWAAAAGRLRADCPVGAGGGAGGRRGALGATGGLGARAPALAAAAAVAGGRGATGGAPAGAGTPAWGWGEDPGACGTTGAVGLPAGAGTPAAEVDGRRLLTAPAADAGAPRGELLAGAGAAPGVGVDPGATGCPAGAGVALGGAVCPVTAGCPGVAGCPGAVGWPGLAGMG